MKHVLKNPATNFAMLLMALATAFTFSCESKEEKIAKAEAEAERAARAAAAAEKVAARADATRAMVKEAEKAAAKEAAENAAKFLACEEKSSSYTVAEGYVLNKTFPGAIVMRGGGANNKVFNLRLPKVVHSKNKKIEKYYDDMISEAKNTAEYFIGGGKSDMSDMDEDYMIYNSDVRICEVRKAHGIVSVVINNDNDYIYGLTFDDSGKIYTVDEILALYGTSLKEVDAAAGTSGEPYFGDKTDIELDENGFDDGVTIYGENSFTVVTQGDLRHSVIATVKDGKFTFKRLFDETNP
jgi:predicted nucleic acid-binding Zn finger protein